MLIKENKIWISKKNNYHMKIIMNEFYHALFLFDIYFIYELHYLGIFTKTSHIFNIVFDIKTIFLFLLYSLNYFFFWIKNINVFNIYFPNGKKNSPHRGIEPLFPPSADEGIITTRSMRNPLFLKNYIKIILIYYYYQFN